MFRCLERPAGAHEFLTLARGNVYDYLPMRMGSYIDSRSYVGESRLLVRLGRASGLARVSHVQDYITVLDTD